ncbi:hypothetical protein ACWEQN_44795 [Streptomyces sp. NPDC004129]
MDTDIHLVPFPGHPKHPRPTLALREVVRRLKVDEVEEVLRPDSWLAHQIEELAGAL